MPDEKAKQITLDVLERLLTDHSGDVRVRLWDDTFWPNDTPRPATLVLRHPGALRAMFMPGTEVGLGEAYLYDDMDIDGSVEAVFELAEELTRLTTDWRMRLRLATDLLRLPKQSQEHQDPRGAAHLRGRRHSLERDRQAISYHYDVSNDFYGLWLDPRMVYSCAYFREPTDDLEKAQLQKLEHICRKLRLQPGQRLLDIGCGWGGLVIYAAQNYGVDCTGITLSKPQAELANARIRAAGLADRCRVLVRDYREVDEPEGYDALVSVGMFEHVGRALLGRYFAQAWGLLRPGGVFLNHGIANGTIRATVKGPNFTDKYVFPDGELVPINITLNVAEESGFEVRDVESLREHYMLTLRQWVSRLEGRHQKALQFVTEPTYRVWRLFLSGSAHNFCSGRLNVYQALLLKPGPQGRCGLPLTRDDWYLAG